MRTRSTTSRWSSSTDRSRFSGRVRHGCRRHPEEEPPMQFVLLIYQGSTPLPGTPEWEGMSADEQKAVYADYAKLNKTEGVSPGPPLGLPDEAVTVRSEGGKAVASDGPYIDVKGAVGGFLVLEAEDLE